MSSDEIAGIHNHSDDPGDRYREEDEAVLSDLARIGPDGDFTKLLGRVTPAQMARIDVLVQQRQQANTALRARVQRLRAMIDVDAS